MQELIQNIKEQLIEVLNLEDISVEEIETDMALFGDDGLGLDSIDALEIILLLEKEYGIKLKDPAAAKPIFYSVNTLAEFIQGNRTK